MLKLSLQENSINTANLYLSNKMLLRRNRHAPSIVDITSRGQPERKKVEQFIKDIYAKSYNAEISVDYPVLMSVRDRDGNILAAVGIRYAEAENLFLEQYTDLSIDKVLGSKRRTIAEIGNLASVGGGASVFLFAALASYLDFKGIEHAVMTGTTNLRGVFKKLGLDTYKICDACMSALNKGGQNWGSYYDTAPQVLTGSVSKGLGKLRRALKAEFKERQLPFTARLHYKIKN